MTIARKTKPGRNDLCPCGSGQKMKRCHGSHRAELEMKSTAVELSSIYHSSLEKAREQIRAERETEQNGRALLEWTWRAIVWSAIAFALFCILVGTSRGAEPTAIANRPAAVSLGRSANKLLPVVYVYSSPAYKQSVDFWNAYSSDAAFSAAIDASYCLKRIEVETCIEQVCRGVVPPEFHIPAQGNILFARVVRGFTTKDELLRRLGLSVATIHQDSPPPKLPRPQPPQQYDLPTPRPPQVIADPTLLKELREMRQEIDARDQDYIEANNEQRAAINKQSDAIQEQTGIVDGLRKWLRGELVDVIKGKVGAIAGAAAGTGEAAGGAASGAGLLQVLLVPLAALLGITPIGAGVTAGSIIAPLAWWAVKKGWNKFRGQKTVTVPAWIPTPPPTVQQPFPVNVDTPSPPQVSTINREVVQYEGPNTEALAYAWAVEQYGRKHPGAETVVAWLENAKQQYLSGAAAAAQKKR